MSAGSVVHDASRQGNTVDTLQEQIRQIQSACQHQFKIVPGSFSLGKSMVEGVLLGSIDGQAITISLRCSECSLEETATAVEVCPHCAGKMIEGDMHEREKYFGEKHLYHGARLYTCEECHRTVAMDEWDQ